MLPGSRNPPRRGKGVEQYEQAAVRQSGHDPVCKTQFSHLTKIGAVFHGGTTLRELLLAHITRPIVGIFKRTTVKRIHSIGLQKHHGKRHHTNQQ